MNVSIQGTIYSTVSKSPDGPLSWLGDPHASRGSGFFQGDQGDLTPLQMCLKQVFLTQLGALLELDHM